MATRHVNIPIFIPELACPHQCVFCDQKRITGQYTLPSDAQIIHTVESHLASIKQSDAEVMIAYFGGSFTGLPFEQQKHFLALLTPYRNKNLIKGIRLSTRPDYISVEVLNLLKSYGVSHIELGAQSLDQEVLLRSGRGHSLKDIEKASELILSYGFKLGLQMMTGLPFDTPHKSLTTAQKIVSLGAHETRIYPTLVIQHTALHQLFLEGKYHPQTLEESLELSAELLSYFEEKGVKVLRVGLFASDSLKAGEYIAGPFHENYLELVRSRQWFNRFAKSSVLRDIIYVSPKDLNHAVGYQSINKIQLQNANPKLKFKVDHSLKEGEWRC